MLPALAELRDVLADRYGRPTPITEGLDPFEALVAVVLDRAMDARKRAIAIDALREEGLLTPQALAEADPAEIEQALRALKIAPKALVPLRRTARWLVELHHGDADALVGNESGVSTSQLRDELTGLNGVGATSADALLLFALNRPVYPLDRPTYRIFARDGWIDLDTGYDDAARRRGAARAGRPGRVGGAFRLVRTPRARLLLRDRSPAARSAH